MTMLVEPQGSTASTAASLPEPPGAGAAATNEALLQRRERYVPAGFYQVRPVVVAAAQGAWITDHKGKRYLDFASGIGVMTLGHSHPEILAAAHAQLDRFTHQSFHVAVYEGYLRLAEELDRLYPAPEGEKPATKSVLLNSGAEAVENALKIARAATDREYVIAFQNAFHGRTYGALAATGRTKPSRLPFMRSLPPNVIHLPFPYPYRPLANSLIGLPAEQLAEVYAGLVERALETEVAPEEVAAILVEPVQGEGGFIVPPDGYLQRLRALCDRHGILLVVDEVQTGFGRTGRLFAIEHWGVVPDLLVTSKALGAGFPLGAVTGRADLMDRLPHGSLGTTFGGHPVSCATALKMIEVMERDRLVKRAARLGRRIQDRFQEMAQRFECIGEVRGLGAMQAIELVKDRVTRAPDADLTERISVAAHERGLLTIRAGLYANVIRLLIPLTIGEDELETGLDLLEAAIESCS